VVQLDRPQRTLQPMRFACWILQATNTQSEYVNLITFPRQQWLLERASMLRYTYLACLVSSRKDNLWPSWWHSFIDLRNSLPPFLLLGSVIPVRNIIWQYSLVSMFFTNGLLFPSEWCFWIPLRSRLKVHPVLYKRCCLCKLLLSHKLLTLRRLMLYIYIYGAPILDVSRSHTTTQHSR